MSRASKSQSLLLYTNPSYLACTLRDGDAMPMSRHGDAMPMGRQTPRRQFICVHSAPRLDRELPGLPRSARVHASSRGAPPRQPARSLPCQTITLVAVVGFASVAYLRLSLGNKSRARGLRRGAPCSCGLGRRRGERTGAVRCSGRRRTAARPRSARARRAPHARRGASTVLEVGAVTRREGGLLPYLGGHGARSTAAQRGGGRHRRGSGRRRREGDAAARRARQAHHRAAQGARAHPRLGQQHAPLDAT